MKLKYLIIFFTLFISAPELHAQKNKTYTVTLNHVFGNLPVQLEESYYEQVNGDSITFQTLKFYLSGIELLNGNIPVWVEVNSFHLIDASSEKTLKFELRAEHAISFNKIKFNLGIDSTTNTSGAMGGDLDPTKGMYWTWQNGYINFKMEGKSNLAKTRKNEFEFHLGGYQYPFNALKSVVLNTDSKNNIDILFDAELFLQQVDLSKENQVMSPGADAILLSEKAAAAFRIR